MTMYPNATRLANALALADRVPYWLAHFLTFPDDYCRQLAKRADNGIGRALPIHGGLWIQIGPCSRNGR